MDNNTLGGFDVFLDQLMPNNVGKQTTVENQDDLDIDGAGEELTDDELEKIKNSQAKTVDDKDTDDSDNSDDDDKSSKSKRKPKKDSDNDSDSEDDDNTNVDGIDTDDQGEQQAISAFFDAISDELGWEDVTDDEKPKTAKDLVAYFRDIIEENSKPDYASEEVEKLDAFVRNGGSLKDYYQIDANLDLEDLNIEDEAIQKAVVKELLKEKGFSTKQIDKKIAKYEDAGLLEDEAQDALEDLKEIREEKKKQLLESQQKYAQQQQQRQQEFFNNVKDEIKGLTDIYGISIPEKDKRALLEYIFKPTSKGITKYQEDYSKSLKNLVTSAYFTMKGDSIISIAKKEGKKDALDNFKNSLTKNTGVNKRSKRTIDSDDDNSIWSAFTRRLRSA